MPWSMLFIWGGVLLVVGGVLALARQAIRRGRLSEVRPAAPGAAGDTLEPSGRGRSFDWQASWPGLALIAGGALLLLVGAAR
ncbi:MAG TPA: hypothetical protein VEY05_06505 [Beijerinckiaceae bacterium]|jgi:hypothetical protein|nr:hypothetical protein [Beijerinckiaceae bacterium]